MFRRKVATKPWVHLDGIQPFDQTNGLVDLGADRADGRTDDALLTLFEKGAASNIVNVGLGGGSF